MLRDSMRRCSGGFRRSLTAVLAVLLLANTQQIASAFADDAARVTAAKTPLSDGPPGGVGVFEGHTVQTPSVAFLPDGRSVMSCSYDGTRVWDVQSGELKLNIKPGGLAAVSPDGSAFAIRWGAAIQLHDSTTGKTRVELTPKPTDVAATIEFSRDGQQLATGGAGGIVRVYDAASGKIVHELQGHSKPVRSVAFHPNGQTLISAGRDQTIRVWDLETGTETRQFQALQGEHMSVAFSPDARHVLSAGYYSDLLLWDFERGTVIRKLNGHIAGVHRAVFAADGRRAVSAADDHTVRVWDVQTGRELAMFEGHQDYVLDVDVSPDGRFAASVSGGDYENGKWVPGDDFTVRIWRLPQTHDGAVSGLQMTDIEHGPEGEYATLGGINADVLGMDRSGDGRLLATGEKDGTVRVWEIESNRPIARLPAHNDMVRAVAFSPDSTQLVTGTHGRKLRLWDVKTRKELLACPDGMVPKQILSADFLADGKRVAVGIHQAVGIWNTETNTFELLKSTPIHPHMIRVSPDGSTIAAACHDSLVRLWDAESGELLHKLTGHTDEIQCVDFTPDGLQLASGSRDRSLRLWDVESGKQLRTFSGHGGWVTSVTCLADGRRIMSGGDNNDGSIRTWDMVTGQQLWWHGTDGKFSRHIAATPDARFAIAANSASVSVLRLPVLHNMTKLEAYELARRNEGPELRIAVLDFVDQGPSVELAPLRHALAELLTARLNLNRRVFAVERLQVEQFLQETKLGASGLVDAETAQHAGQTLTADFLLSGSFSGRDDSVTVEATLTKIGAEKPLASWTVSGKAVDLFNIEQQLATRTLTALDIKSTDIDAAPPGELGPSPNVAVLSFRNLGGVALPSDPGDESLSDAELNAMQSGIGEFLQVALSALPDVKLVEREDIDSILSEQELSLSSVVDATSAARVGKLAGAERFIYGSFLESAGKITVVARLADTETATVLATEIADGTADDIATMLQELALRLATRLNVRQPKDADHIVWRAVPVRKLEAAVYGSRAMAQVRKGNYDGAFDNFDRALLVEPDSLELRVQYVRALYRTGRTDRLINIADATLALDFPPQKSTLKSTVYAYYLNSLRYANRHEERVEVARRYAKEFPGSSYRQRSARAAEARSLRGSNRRAEAVALLEAEVMKAEASGNDVAYGDELAQLFQFYDSELSFYSGGSRNPKVTEESARRAVETAERLLALAQGRRGRSAAYWGRVICPQAVTVTHYKEGERGSTFLLDIDERIDLLNRIRSTFSWDQQIMSRAAFELGEQSERGEKFELALEGFREFLANGFYEPAGVISSYDRDHIQPNDWIDHQLECQYRIGRILHEELKQPEEATAAFQEYVQTYGLANFHGPHVTKGLKELGVEPQFPEKSVLLWGGASEALHSWRKVLEPLGFAVHIVRQHHLTAADLSPYDLVVMIRSGDLPLDPVDVLGLRSYVATGGSLLTVLTPAWESGAPQIHNGLLSLFGIQADADDIDPAPATQIDAEHPITQRVPAATARHGVALRCPKQISLIESDGQTLLAATPYRAGRVVVSSFGQWIIPDPTIYGAQWQRHLQWRYGSSRPLSSMPIESFSGTNATLLKQTIAWLTEAGPDDEHVASQRELFEPAWRAARQFEGRSLPRDEMTQAMNQLVDQTQGEWKEEALWLAGEAHLRMYYFYTKYHLRWPSYGYNRDEARPLPKPEYFDRLAAQFPNSPLLPFAQWRRAECLRRDVLRGTQSRSDSINSEEARDLIELYSAVEASEGSIPWAWTQLRLGRVKFFSGDAAAAAEHYRAVSEQMPAGPEKVRALLDLARCSHELGQPERAATSAEAVLALPNFQWWDRANEHFAPLVDRTGNSKYMASRLKSMTQ